jgi:hypothetical protein
MRFVSSIDEVFRATGADVPETVEAWLQQSGVARP